MSACVGIIRVGVMTVVELNDMKSAAIDIEMDIALFEIRRDRFPDLYFGVQLLYRAPCGVSNAFAVYFRRDIQYFKITVFAVCRYYNSSDFFAFKDYPIRFAAVYLVLYRFAGNDLIIFFIMVIAQSEFLKRAVIESLLIVEYELLAVIRL